MELRTMRGCALFESQTCERLFNPRRFQYDARSFRKNLGSL
jgi:hypothetical protein